MKLRNIFLSLTLLLSAAAGYAEDKTVTRPVSVSAGFSEVDVATGIKLIYTPAATTKLTATGTPEDLERLEIVRTGAALKIRFKSSGSIFGQKIFNSRKNRVTVTMSAPALREYEASSGASIEVTAPINLASQNVEVDISSGASFSAGTIVCKSLDVEVSSGASASIAAVKASDVEVEASSGAAASVGGQCTTAQLEASSGASVSAGSLNASSGTASASSGGSVSSAIANPSRIHKSSGGSVSNRK